jgi:phage-related protein
MKFKTFATIAAFTTAAFSLQANNTPEELNKLVNSLDQSARSTLVFVNKFIDAKNRSEKFSDQIAQANAILVEIKKLNVEVKELLSQPISDEERNIIQCANEIADLIIPSLENLCRAMESQRGQTDTTKLSAALKPSLTNMAAQGPTLKVKVDTLHKLLSTVYTDAAAKVKALQNDILNTVDKIAALDKNKMAYVNLFAALKQRLSNG